MLFIIFISIILNMLIENTIPNRLHRNHFNYHCAIYVACQPKLLSIIEEYQPEFLTIRAMRREVCTIKTEG